MRKFLELSNRTRFLIAIFLIATIWYIAYGKIMALLTMIVALLGIAVPLISGEKEKRETERKMYKKANTLEALKTTLLAEKKEQIDKLKNEMQRQQRENAGKEVLIPKLSNKIAKLEKQLIEKEDKIQEFVKYNETVGKDASPRYKEAFELITKGRLDDAIALLKDEVLKAEANDLKTNEDKGETPRKRLAAEYVLKAQAFNLKNDAKNAETNYLKAIGISPSCENNLQAAKFYHKQNNIQAAETCYTRCLSLVKNPEEKAIMLSNVGVLFWNVNNYPKAAQAYEEAFKIWYALATANPVYVPTVATTFDNMGALYWKTKDYPKASEAYEGSLKIRRALADINPKAFLPTVATTLGAAGTLYEDMNDCPQAVKAYEEALKIYRDLADVNPQAYLLQVAMRLNNIATLYGKMDNYPKAAETFEEALEVFRTLAEAHPHTYLLDVAGILNNLGILNRKMRNYPKADKAYVEALKIYRALADVDPHTCRPYVATMLSNIDILHKEMKNPQSAEAYEEALEMERNLVAANRKAYLPDAAPTQNLSILHKKIHKELPKRPKPGKKPRRYGTT